MQSQTVQTRVDKRENPTLTLKLSTSAGEYAEGARYSIHLGGAAPATSPDLKRLEGCIKDVHYELQSSNDGLVALDWKDLPSGSDEAYEECQDCPCLHGGVCLDGGKCDCSHSAFEGPTCASPGTYIFIIEALDF